MPESRRPAAAAVAVLAAAALAACGSETIQADDLEQQLADQLGADAGVQPESVDCPDDIEVEQGREFECTLVAPNGDEVMVNVTLTDDEGGFEAEVPPEQFE